MRATSCKVGTSPEWPTKQRPERCATLLRAQAAGSRRKDHGCLPDRAIDAPHHYYRSAEAQCDSETSTDRHTEGASELGHWLDALGCAACKRARPATHATENRLSSTVKASARVGTLIWPLWRNGLHRSTVRHQEVDKTTSNTRSGQNERR
jgi:hypothetical protein